jgi:RNA polymerase primary sigma factor
MTDGELAEALFRCIARIGPSDAGALAACVSASQQSAPGAHQVAKVLYLRSDLFRRVNSSQGASRWEAATTPAASQRQLNPSPSGARSRPQPRNAESLESDNRVEVASREIDLSALRLHAWQAEALEAWRRAGRVGVVEAVTGAGKTRVALCAIAETLAQAQARVLVLVPTMALATQWREQLERLDFGAIGLPPPRIGMLGGGSSASMQDHDIIVSTNQSAARRTLLRRNGPSLLVGDEVHRLGAPTWAKALDSAFKHRLGLTATLERDDEGVDEIIHPYFGKTVFTLGLGRALADRIVAPFHVTFMAVQLSASEQRDYDEATKLMGQSIGAFARSGEVPMQPFGTMIKAVQSIATHHGSTLVGPARAFLKAFSDRRAILAEARNKPARLAELAPVIRDSGRALLFAETTKATRGALTKLRALGVAASSIDGTMPSEDRERVMDEFRRGHIQVIAAPRVLDEGIDVPEADVGVIVGGSASRRQLIQRLGRVIRRKPDERSARVFVLFVKGTPEDPESKAREDVVAELCEHASSVKILGPGIIE